MINRNNGNLYFAGAVAGGADPEARLAGVMQGVVGEGRSLDSIAAQAPEASGRLNAYACAGKPDASRCAVVTDPRGAGFAEVVGRD